MQVSLNGRILYTRTHTHTCTHTHAHTHMHTHTHAHTHTCTLTHTHTHTLTHSHTHTLSHTHTHTQLCHCPAERLPEDGSSAVTTKLTHTHTPTHTTLTHTILTHTILTHKGYQKTGPVQGAVTTKLKGAWLYNATENGSFTQNCTDSDEGWMVFDPADYIIPPQVV